MMGKTGGARLTVRNEFEWSTFSGLDLENWALFFSSRECTYTAFWIWGF